MSGRQFFYILIATLITVIIWATLDILHSRAKIQPPEEVQKLLDPIDPNLDTDTINSL